MKTSIHLHWTSILLLAGSHFIQANAGILRVPSDYTTIQNAVDNAAEGDTVLIDPGTYVENVVIDTQSVTLGSLYLTTLDSSYVSQTVIDGGDTGSVVSVRYFNESVLSLIGLTLIHGKADKGGGLFALDSKVNAQMAPDFLDRGKTISGLHSPNKLEASINHALVLDQRNHP